MKRGGRVLAILAVITCWTTVTVGNDRKFAYTYETLVLPPGAREIEVWSTFRTDRGYFYRRFDQRVEYEFGVSENVMSALYVNHSSRIQDSNGGLAGGVAVTSSSVSISNEWKFKVLDRVADPVGLGFYSEATLGLDEIEVEAKILVDKQLGNLLVAFNAVAENEWKTELTGGNSETLSELTAELDLGVAYTLNSHWSLGVELRNHNEIVKGEWAHSAFFAGPAVSYSAESWWATLNVMPQLGGFKGATNGNLVLDGHEKLEARLLFSFHL